MIIGKVITASRFKRHETYTLLLTGNILIISALNLITPRNVERFLIFHLYLFTRFDHWPNFLQNELRQSLATERSPEFHIILFLSRIVQHAFMKQLFVASYSWKVLLHFIIWYLYKNMLQWFFYTYIAKLQFLYQNWIFFSCAESNFHNSSKYFFKCLHSRII